MPLTKKQRKQLRKQGVLNDTTRGLKLHNIEPITVAQSETFNAFYEDYHLLLHGVAGTGKTFLSLYLALQKLFTSSPSKYHNVKIIRSVVPTRDIGFLPGRSNEKIEVYEQPYRTICTELFGRSDAYEILKTKGDLEFITTSFIRGCTFDNTIIIADEIQNMNDAEINTIMTRVGRDCKVILAGDFRQNDLYKSKFDKSGLSLLLNVADKMESIRSIDFGIDDIVRSGFVREYIEAIEDIKDAIQT